MLYTFSKPNKHIFVSQRQITNIVIFTATYKQFDITVKFYIWINYYYKMYLC